MNKTMENELLSLSVIEEPGCSVRVDVKAQPKLVLKAHQKAIDNVRKQVSIPGFRKGRVPEGLLFTHFSTNIDREWRDVLLNDAFQSTVELLGKAPIRNAKDRVEARIKTISTQADPATLYFAYECYPIVPSFDADSIKVDLPPRKEVTDADVEATIEQARLAWAEWDEVKDRAVQEGDYVRLDLTEIEPYQTTLFSGRQLQAKEGKMADWLKALVIGTKPNESREGFSVPEQAFEEDDVEDELKALFKPARYRATVRSIETPTLPELNDDFAKKLGADNVQQMRERIKMRLIAQNEAKRHKAISDALEEAIFVQVPFELPKSLVNKDADAFENSKMQLLKTHGHLTEAEVRGHKAKLRQLSERDSQKRLALYYLLAEYNKKNGIEVSRKDMNDKLSQVLSHIPQEQLPTVVKNLTEEFYSAVMSETVIEKGLEHIASKKAVS